MIQIKKTIVFIIALFPFVALAQTEKFPIFEACQNDSITNVETCFYSETKRLFFQEFKTPEIVKSNHYEDKVNATFIVTSTGEFKLIFIGTPYKEIKEEVTRVFASFPKITPATYNNHNIEMQFVLPISFPISDNVKEYTVSKQENKKDINLVVEQQQIADSTFLEHSSQLNIPFVHQKYVGYEYALNKSTGSHTAVKPYIYSKVNKHFDFEADKKQFLKPEKKSWWGRKFWNEHLLQVKQKDYWLTADFLVDVQLGKDNSENVTYTFNNTRLLTVNGGLGKDFAFSATVYESQGRFADYINQYASNKSPTFRPAFSEGLVPGRGKAKGFKTDAYDYPVAEGYLSYTPSQYLQFQFGHGKNFIGDGYRSFLLSDVSSPSPYLKMTANIWKLQYTNIWLWGTDVRHSAVVNNEHARKYIAIHYLSVNITDKLNLGFFETAISAGNQGFDAGFLNPLIFYRSVEFGRGEDAGNAMVGLTAKYKLQNDFILYSQLLVDEFSIGNLGDLSDWRNKFGYQLGAKYFNALEVDNLYLQGEFNYARPFTFAHKNPILNYGHYSQPLAHAWGANFWEMIAIARYKKERWSGSAKLIFGKRGYDKGTNVSYGGDIYQSYNDRIKDTGNEIGQGNTASIFMIDAQGNYLINPANGLSFFTGVSYRSFSPETATATFKKDTNIWLTAGIKVDLFNWYFDF